MIGYLFQLLFSVSIAIIAYRHAWWLPGLLFPLSFFVIPHSWIRRKPKEWQVISASEQSVMRILFYFMGVGFVVLQASLFTWHLSSGWFGLLGALAASPLVGLIEWRMEPWLNWQSSPW